MHRKCANNVQTMWIYQYLADKASFLNNNKSIGVIASLIEFVKLRIKHKLFLLLLSANLLLATGILVVNSWSFSAGFIDYINRTEQKRFIPFNAELVKQYKLSGDWSWIHRDHDKWRTLIQRYIYQRERHPRSRPPRPRKAFEQQNRRPPPQSPDHLRNHRNRPRPPPGRGSRLITGTGIAIDSHLLLKNKQHQLVIGDARRLDEAHWLPIHDGKQIIGYLGFRRLLQLDEELNILFAEQQKNSFLYTALGMLLISVLFALPVAQRLVHPMQQLAAATKKLAAGDYSTRFPLKRTDELGDLARHFNSLAQTLEKNLAARQQWIADISHELRTPVAILQGEIEALQDGIHTVTPEALASLHQEIRRLNSLINDLHELTMADMGALDYHKQSVDLGELLEDRMNAFKIQLAKKNLKVHTRWLQQPYWVWADERRLTQVITNLMQNSLRYTDADGVIMIQLTQKPASQQYQLIWSDSSPGVDAKHLPHLFDRLYRAEQSRNRSKGGSGLGLAITEKIIEAHQGHIEARPSELGGLSIIITLPIHT